MKRPRVVIVGGGFAGLEAAKTLRHAPVEVVVIDRTNHHLFQPLLYQVATGTLAPSDITAPIRWLLRKQRNTRVILGEVTRVDRERRAVLVDSGAIIEPYDYLIIGSGARHSYFGHDEWEESAPGLKSLDDALEIRNRFLSAFERAEIAATEEERQAYLTFVIVGGGPTGVELAGIMRTIAKTALRGDFRTIDTTKARVLLLEGGNRVLPAMSPSLSARALRDLQEIGVEVRLESLVTGVEPGVVCIGRERIPTRTVFWAAGNRASSLGRQLGVPLDRAGRVQVTADLSIPGDDRVFVCGDLAAFTSPGQDGQPAKTVPNVAPAAVQMGRAAARNVLRDLRDEDREPFHYFNKGDLATIGRYRAVAAFGGLEVTGASAWFLWLFVHIMYLAGFRNRLSVLLQWAWAYFTWQRGVRLIYERHTTAQHTGEYSLGA